MKRKTNVFATRVMGPSVPRDAFDINVWDEKTGACVSIRLTPEQFALAMWSRGDIVVEAEWTGVSFDAEKGGKG